MGAITNIRPTYYYYYQVDGYFRQEYPKYIDHIQKGYIHDQEGCLVQGRVGARGARVYIR